jgi:hypothetical protein
MYVKQLLIKVSFCTLIILVFRLSEIHAQVSITTSGGNISGNQGSVSYSVGQVIHTAYTGTTGSIIQGVQQPFEISILTDINEIKGINLSYTVYPNPVNEYLTLKIEDLSIDNLIYQLLTIEGKIIESDLIENKETEIFVNNLNSATFLLKVIQNNSVVRVFKIIKN